MNLGTFYVLCIIFSFQISYSSSALSEAWNRFMTFSCEFSPDLEKFLPSEERRFKRSAPAHEEPNFDNPAELFAYLYPLANVKVEDVPLEAQRSSSSFQSNPIYGWITELGSLWVNECKIRTNIQVTKEDFMEGTKEEHDYESSSASNNVTHALPGRRKRNAYSKSSLSPKDQGSSEFRNGSRVTDGRRPMSPKLDIRKKGKVTTSTEAPTTTADPGASDDNFFSSYGGDIEYFFPLISFGIPFDGEITFLGFHGFKGLFPYK